MSEQPQSFFQRLKHRFFKRLYTFPNRPFYHRQILTHLKALSRLKTPHIDQRLPWPQLIEASSDPVVFEQKKAQFLQAQAYFNLTTHQMYQALVDHLYPLKHTLESALEDIEASIDYYQKSLFLGYPKLTYLNALKEEWTQHLNKLNEDERQWIQILHDRLQVDSNKDRHFENHRARMIESLNALLPEEKHLEIPQSHSILSDDCRLQLFDLLKTHGYETSSFDDMRLRQETYMPVMRPEKYHRKLKALTKNIQTLKASLALKAKDIYTDPTKNESWWSQYIAPTLNRLIPYPALFANRSKYFWALGLSMMLYFSLVPAVLAQLSLFIGPTLSATVGQVLWYGAALLPVWGFLLEKVNHFFVNLQLSITKSKRETLLETFDTLLRHQNSLINPLSRGILDTPYYDIQALQIQVQTAQDHLLQLKEKLSKRNLTERLLMPDHFEERLRQSLNLIQAQSRLISSLSIKFCDHIAIRLKKDLSSMILAVDRCLAPKIPHLQIQKYQTFIDTFGSPTQKETFNDTLNLMPSFKLALQRSPLYRETHAIPKSVSWGQRHLDKPRLKAWKQLAQATHDSNLIELIGLLQGKSHCTLKRLIALCGEQEDLKTLIQQHFFHAARDYPTDMVHLWRHEHQMALQSWFSEHQTMIQHIESLIEKLIHQKCIDKDVLDGLTDDPSIFCEVMDNAHLAYELNGQSHNKKHRVREALDAFDGSSETFFYLLRLFSHPEKNIVAHQLAEKRLNWCLEHPECEFQREDIELFHAPYLETFDFKALVQAHVKHHALEPSMRAFIQQCVDKGFMPLQECDTLLKAPASPEPTSLSSQGAIRVSV